MHGFIITSGQNECPFGPENVYPDKNEGTGKFYKISWDKLNYTSARELCERDGGHLVMIKDQEDLDFIVNYYNKTAAGMSLRSYFKKYSVEQCIETG